LSYVYLWCMSKGEERAYPDWISKKHQTRIHHE
jgi:hypothetical protein